MTKYYKLLKAISIEGEHGRAHSVLTHFPVGYVFKNDDLIWEHCSNNQNLNSYSYWVYDGVIIIGKKDAESLVEVGEGEYMISLLKYGDILAPYRE